MDSFNSSPTCTSSPKYGLLTNFLSYFPVFGFITMTSSSIYYSGSSPTITSIIPALFFFHPCYDIIIDDFLLSTFFLFITLPSWTYDCSLLIIFRSIMPVSELRTKTSSSTYSAASFEFSINIKLSPSFFHSFNYLSENSLLTIRRATTCSPF